MRGKKFLMLVVLTVFSGLTYAEEFDFSGSFRTRAEYRNNKDFDSRIFDEILFVNSRLRVSGEFKPTEWVLIKGTFQDARVFGISGARASRTNPLETVNFTATNSRSGVSESIDFIEAFLQVEREVFGGSTVSFRVGRQRVFYGEHRILGTFDWSNVSNSFDGAKLSFSNELLKIDGFGYLLRENSVREGAVELPTGERGKSYLLGIYSSVLPTDEIQADLYFLYLRDDVKLNWGGVGFENWTFGVSRPANIFAPGGRLDAKFDVRTLKPFFNFEGVFEFGNACSYALQAFAFAGRVGSEFDVALKPKFFVEFDLASGTRKAEKDKGIRRTFYNFFPTNHIHYGYADLFSWKNMKALRFHGSVKPLEKLGVELDIWKFWLFTTEDWWYHAGQSPLVRTTLPYPSDDAGLEIDLTLKLKLFGVGWTAGYSAFLPGKLLKAIGKDDVQHWGYVQVLAKF